MKKMSILVVILLMFSSVSYGMFVYGTDDAATVALWHMDVVNTTDFSEAQDGSKIRTWTPDDDSAWAGTVSQQRLGHDALLGMYTATYGGFGPDKQPTFVAAGGFDGSGALYFDGDTTTIAAPDPDQKIDCLSGGIKATTEFPGLSPSGSNHSAWSAGNDGVMVQLQFKMEVGDLVSGFNSLMVGAPSIWEAKIEDKGVSGGVNIWMWAHNSTTSGGGYAYQNMSYAEFFGQWHHFEGSYVQGSDQVQLKVDGSSAGNTYFGWGTDLNHLMRDASGKIMAGEKPGNNTNGKKYPYKGLLDEVQVWSIPEPATMVLLSLGGLLLRRRR